MKYVKYNNTTFLRVMEGGTVVSCGKPNIHTFKPKLYLSVLFCSKMGWSMFLLYLTLSRTIMHFHQKRIKDCIFPSNLLFEHFHWWVRKLSVPKGSYYVSKSIIFRCAWLFYTGKHALCPTHQTDCACVPWVWCVILGLKWTFTCLHITQAMLFVLV